MNRIYFLWNQINHIICYYFYPSC